MSHNESLSASLKESSEERESLEQSLLTISEEAKISSSDINDLQNEVERLSKENSVFEQSIKDMQRDKQTLESTLSETQAHGKVLEEGKSTLQQENDAIKTKIDQLMKDQGDSCDTVKSLMDDKALLEEETERLQNEKEEIMTKMQNLQDSSDNTVQEMKEQIDDLLTIKANLEKECECLKDSSVKYESMHSELVAIGEKNSILENKLKDFEVHNLELLEKEALVLKRLNSLELTVKEKDSRLSDMSSLLETESAKLSDAFKELEFVKREKKNIPEEVNEFNLDVNESTLQLKKFEEEVEELQGLLASAIQREEEARSVAIAADEELTEKERELQEAMKIASESEEAAKIAQEKLERHVCQGSSSFGQEQEEILKDMELLMDEKLEVEARLEKEISDRKASEEELKRIMGDEQRSLVQEAEMRMNNLRNQLADANEQSLKCNEKFQLTLQEIEKLKELNENNERKINEFLANEKKLQEEIRSSKIKEERLKQELTDLHTESENFKLHVNTVKGEFKVAADGKVNALKDELAMVKVQLYETESKSSSLAEDLKARNKELEIVKNKTISARQALLTEKEFAISKVKEELAIMKIQLSKVEANAFSLKQEKNKYKEELKKIKMRNVQVKQAVTQEAEKVMITLQDKLNKYKSDAENALRELSFIRSKCDEENAMNKESQRTLMEELEKNKKLSEKLLKYEEMMKESAKQIKSKDSRIKNLEGKRLTKEQLEMIKAIKEERSNLKQTCSEYKKKLLKAEEEVKNFKNEKYNFDSHDQSQIILIKEKNEALEKKLRKFHAHCEHLESEKSGIIELVKSTLQDEDISKIDVNFSSCVIALCEKLNNLEEECEALVSAEKKNSTYLVEIDRLKENNETIKLKLEDISTQLSNVSDEKKRLRKKLDQFQRMAESARTDAAELEREKSRQISYLEKENLQLHGELRSTKKNLQKVRAAKPLKFDDTGDQEEIGVSPNITENKENNIDNKSFSKTKKVKNEMSETKRKALDTIQNQTGLGTSNSANDEGNTGECSQS